MFEIDDVKIGRAKVVSITEARQAIATIMTDREFSYIITKNNEPVRVVVNYETLKKFQLSEDSPPLKHALTHDTSALLGAPLIKPAKQGRTLRGLLKEREDDLKSQEDIKPPQMEEKRRAVNDYGSFKEEKNLLKTMTFKPLQPPSEIENLKPKENFYAQKNQAEESHLQNEAQLLVETEDVVENEQDLSLGNDQDYEANEFEGEFFGNDHELPPPVEEPAVNRESVEERENVYQDLSLRVSEEKIQEDPIEDESIAPKAEDPQANMTEEEKNYFRKFQKLYAPQETANPSASLEENIEASLEEDKVTSDIIKRRGLSDFPSIDDLLKELEHTKLTGEE